MALTPSKQKQATARERVLAYLAENPDGASKSRLNRLVDGNKGAFRRLIDSMESLGQVVIIDMMDPDCGPTKIVRLPEHAGRA